MTQNDTLEHIRTSIADSHRRIDLVCYIASKDPDLDLNGPALENAYGYAHELQASVAGLLAVCLIQPEEPTEPKP